jgi:hypothetical protein
VVAVREKPVSPTNEPLSASWLRELALACEADDVGLVSLDRPELDDQRHQILRAFPATRTLVSFVCRMNREPIRSPARSVANLEFDQTTDDVNDVWGWFRIGLTSSSPKPRSERLGALAIQT